MGSRGPTKPTAEQLDLVRSALRKRQGGGKPNRSETAAERVVLAWRTEQAGLDFCRSLPKRILCKMFGRPGKALSDWSGRYGFPLDGDQVDLFEIFKSIGAYLARHKRTLPDDGDDPLLAGASPSLRDEYIRAQIDEKREKALLARLDRLSREQSLRPTDEIRIVLGQWSARLREFGDWIQRRDDTETFRQLADVLDDQERILTDYFGAAEPDPPPHEPDPNKPDGNRKRKPTRKRKNG